MEGHHLLVPSVVTPRSQLKRKHAEVIDLTADDATSVKRAATPVNMNGALVRGSPPNNEQARQARLEDDDVGGASDEDGESYYEDVIDHFELEPWVPGEGDTALGEEAAAALRAELRMFGAHKFFEKHVTLKQTPPRLLGTAFGVDPTFLAGEEETYEELLWFVLERASKKRQKLEQYNTIDDAAHLLKERCNIMLITGAGISTSLGIPDFRSQGTGFYDKVREMGLASGEDVFTLSEFDRDPSLFYKLAGDIIPNTQRYSPTHAFLRLLQDKKRLQTNYTQNIDNLEALAGLERSRLIQCHGSFATASCRKCKHKVSGDTIFADIRAKRVSYCKKCEDELAKKPHKPKLKPQKFKLKKNDWEEDSDDGDHDIPQPGVMKPDITFFGEQLSDHFFDRFQDEDAPSTDLVIVIGTSLKVAPVSEMPNHLPPEVPHIYISREPIEHVNFDIQLLGDCDHVVYELCQRAGWELRHEMIPRGFRVDVAPAEGSNYRWRVKPVKPKPATPMRARTSSPFASLLGSIDKRKVDL